MKRFFLSIPYKSRDGKMHGCAVREVVLEASRESAAFAPVHDGLMFDQPAECASVIKAVDAALSLAKASVHFGDEMYHIRHIDDMAASLLRMGDSDEFRIHLKIVRSRQNGSSLTEAVTAAEAEFASRHLDLPVIKEGDRLLCVRDIHGTYSAGLLVRDGHVAWSGMARSRDGSVEDWYPGLEAAIEAEAQAASASARPQMSL